MKYQKTTLPNGLRVITVPTKGNPSVMVMVAVETGSNYEKKEENGLSHFLEHMCFKGTTLRPKADAISQELEGLGAENNAFTSNEFTGYYAKASKKHFHKLFEIISDLYLNPTIPAADLERERGVILEELNMYEDLPHRKVGEISEELLYGDTPAGRTILGTKENIKRFTREEFVNYRHKHYVAGKTMIIISGDISPATVLKEVKKNFKDISQGKKLGKPRVVESQKSPQLLVRHKKTDQTHMIMSFRTYSAKDKRNLALTLLIEVLGVGMSSRLFSKLRTEMGACYYVRAGRDQYTDHGTLNISTGINVSRTIEVVKVLLEECQKLIDTPISHEELEKAKEHYIGHLYMALETTDALALFYMDQEIKTHAPESPQEIEKKIRAVTAKEIMKIAKDIFRNNNLNLAIVGDIKDPKPVKKVLTLK